jgi:hypothetical protein
MPTDYMTWFLPLACAGLGLCLVGVLNLVLSGSRPVVRLSATLAVLAIPLAVAAMLDLPHVLAQTAAFLGVALLACLVLCTRRVVSGAAAAFASLRWPAIRFGLATTAGVVMIVASVVAYEHADKAAMDADTAEMELVGGTSTRPSRHTSTTDRGTPIVLREPTELRDADHLAAGEAKVLGSVNHGGHVIRNGPPSDGSNCHGWVFTGGRFLLTDGDVERILKENGYEEVEHPRTGDVVVYRAGSGITHTAVVRYVTEGQPVMVEGKWGAFSVFLHPADRSIYGTDYTFHRSPRPGHLLAGLADPAPHASPPATHATE